MSWVRLDDGFIDHPKFLQAGPLAGFLHIAAIAWSNQNLTDGVIPRAQPARLAAWHTVNEDLSAEVVGKIPAHQEAVAWAQLVGKLLDLGLWHERDDGDYEIHDYHRYQPSRAAVLAGRDDLSAKRAEAGRRGAAQRWQSDGNANGKPDGKPMANRYVGQMQGEMANQWQTDGPNPNTNTNPNKQLTPALSSSAELPPGVREKAEEVNKILGTHPRLTAADPNAIVELILGHPKVDAVSAARDTVAAASDPTWRTTDAAAAFGHLLRHRERSPAAAAPEADDEMRQLEAAFPDAPATKVRAAAGQLRHRGIPVTEEALRDFGQQYPVWALDDFEPAAHR